MQGSATAGLNASGFATPSEEGAANFLFLFIWPIFFFDGPYYGAAAEFNVHAVDTLHRFWLHPYLRFKRFDKLFPSRFAYLTNCCACWAAAGAATDQGREFIADYEAIGDSCDSAGTLFVGSHKESKLQWS